MCAPHEVKLKFQVPFLLTVRTSNVLCRFEGTDTGLRRKYQLRKRMAKAIGLDREAAAKAAEMEMEMAVAADKNALQGEQNSDERASLKVS